MNSAHSSLADGLLKALQAERDGHSFYMMAAASSSDPKGKRIFEVLAREELEHMRFLQEHYDSIVKTGKLSESAKLAGKNDLDVTSPIFSDSIKARIKDAHYEMSALSIGIQLELNSMSFYRSEAESTDSPVARKFYAELAEWESGHYHALLKQHEELKSDYWADAGFAPF